jgi:pimeloyl-ACP methyl ester carboxylesterase
MLVFVGGADELFLPEKFGQVFGAERQDIPVTILPGMGHSDMITKPEAIHAVVNAFPARGNVAAGALDRARRGESSSAVIVE